MAIPEGITRDHVLQALREIDAGATGDFGPSTKYDLLYKDRRYPPKMVVGLAAKALTGVVMIPKEFSSGLAGSQAIGYLRNLGFEVVKKDDIPRRFGEIPGVPVGTTFPDRKSLSEAGVHRPTQAGISGSGSEGADSIVLSGGYEDDEDYGDVIIYTGHGGKDQATGRQVADQELTRGNLALAVSCRDGLPVRVTRGEGLDSDFAPTAGYRYDGLYSVESYWHEPGRSGFRVCRYRLVREGGQVTPWETTARLPTGEPRRRETTFQRIVRNTEAANRVKRLHDYHCQVCGLRLETPTGPYAEGAHIRPLGSPHNGPDTESNILCLCPNHHVLFDLGAFTITEDLHLTGVLDQLRTTEGHRIDRDCIRYHREHFGTSE
jgi:putative restriction endonuclease